MGFEYSELSDKAKLSVKYWLDENPLDYEDDNGKTMWEYPSEWEENDISEFCEMNEYIFDKHGKVLHHLIEG